MTRGMLAELLQVNQQTVRNWIDRGELQAVRVGRRRVRVRQSELDRFLEPDSSAEEASPERQDPGHPVPTGPEDPTAGCVVGLTTAQLARVQELDPDHTLEIERRGAGWVRLRVFAAEGEVFQEADLPPV